jgi:hypothetical protein
MRSGSCTARQVSSSPAMECPAKDAFAAPMSSRDARDQGKNTKRAPKANDPCISLSRTRADWEMPPPDREVDVRAEADDAAQPVIDAEHEARELRAKRAEAR